MIDINRSFEEANNKIMPDACRILTSLIRRDSNTAPQIIEYLNKRLSSQLRPNIEEVYPLLNEIIQRKPNLDNEVLGSFQIAYPSKHHASSNLENIYPLLKSIVLAQPKHEQLIFKYFKHSISSPRNSEESIKIAFSSLFDIAKANPMLAPQAFDCQKNISRLHPTSAYKFLSTNHIDSKLASHKIDCFKTALSSSLNNESYLSEAYDALNTMVKYHPDEAPQIFDCFRQALSSNANFLTNSLGTSKEEYGIKAFSQAYISLTDILKRQPDLAPEVFDCFNHSASCFQKNHQRHLSTLYSSLSEIVQTDPKFAPHVFDCFKQTLSLDTNGHESTCHAGNCLHKIATTQPNLAPEIFDCFNHASSLDNFNEYRSFLIDSSLTISNLVLAQPKLCSQALDYFNRVASLKDGQLFLYEALADIVVAKPELAPEVFDCFTQNLCSKSDHSYAVEDAEVQLQRIVRDKPELAPYVFDCCKHRIVNITQQLSTCHFLNKLSKNSNLIPQIKDCLTEAFSEGNYPAKLQICLIDDFIKNTELRKSLFKSIKQAKISQRTQQESSLPQKEKNLNELSSEERAQKIAKAKQRILENKGAYQNDVSGAVVADKIAEATISSVINEPVSPEKGQELAINIKNRIIQNRLSNKAIKH